MADEHPFIRARNPTLIIGTDDLSKADGMMVLPNGEVKGGIDLSAHVTKVQILHDGFTVPTVSTPPTPSWREPIKRLRVEWARWKARR